MKTTETYTHEEERERTVYHCDREDCDEVVLADDVRVVSKNPRIEVVDRQGNPYSAATGLSAVTGETFTAHSQGDKVTFREDQRLDLCPGCYAELRELINWFADGGLQ